MQTIEEVRDHFRRNRKDPRYRFVYESNYDLDIMMQHRRYADCGLALWKPTIVELL